MCSDFVREHDRSNSFGSHLLLSGRKYSVHTLKYDAEIHYICLTYDAQYLLFTMVSQRHVFICQFFSGPKLNWDGEIPSVFSIASTSVA